MVRSCPRVTDLVSQLGLRAPFVKRAVDWKLSEVRTAYSSNSVSDTGGALERRALILPYLAFCTVLFDIITRTSSMADVSSVRQAAPVHDMYLKDIDQLCKVSDDHGKAMRSSQLTD